MRALREARRICDEDREWIWPYFSLRVKVVTILFGLTMLRLPLNSWKNDAVFMSNKVAIAVDV